MNIRKYVVAWPGFLLGGVVSLVIAVAMFSINEQVNAEIVAQVETPIPDFPGARLVCRIERMSADAKLMPACEVKMPEVE